MPNQTLIIYKLEKTEALLSQECSPIVIEGLKLINPLKSFSQICVEHGLAYSEILKVAKHLVFWSQAKVIYPVTLKQVYVINSKVDE